MTNDPGSDPAAVPGSSGDESAQATRPRRVVDQGKLWIGGVMAGLVAAGVAIVGLLVARGIADIPVLVERDGELVNADTWRYAGAAFVAALVVTGLLNVLLLWAPQPFQFFAWIVGLATTIAVLVPFTLEVELASKVATALINLAIGLCIERIVSGVGRGAARVVVDPPAG